jgi:hypothetical protein
MPDEPGSIENPSFRAEDTIPREEGLLLGGAGACCVADVFTCDVESGGRGSATAPQPPGQFFSMLAM